MGTAGSTAGAGCTVTWTAYGRPATEALHAAVRVAKAGDPLAPVTVVVPSNLAGVAARRLLASGVLGGTGIANVAFVTPLRLAELLTADLADLGPQLTNPVLGAAVREALSAEPGPFARVAGHPATEAALTHLYAELSQLPAEHVDRLESHGGLTAAAVTIHRRIAERLQGFIEERDVAEAAARRADLQIALAPMGALIWYLPDRLPAGLLGLMRELVERFDLRVVIGLTGDDAADAPVLDSCRAAGVPIPDRLDAPEPAHATKLISVTDPDEEARAVVRAVAALAQQGVPLDRIGVFYPATDPYLRTLRQAFDDAGIPCNSPSGTRLADTVAGRTLLGALALPDDRWRRDKVLGLVSSAPVRHDGRLATPSAWESVSRRAGVVRDLDDWERKLADRVDQLEAAATHPDAPGAVQRELTDVRSLAAFVSGLARAVDAVTQAPTWQGKSTAALALLEQLIGRHDQRTRWPEGEIEATERIEGALVRLAQLDAVEPGPTPEAFQRALSGELGATRGRAGRVGVGVEIGPLATAVGHDLDAVFVVGMAEGSCPRPRRDDSLLPDRVRQTLPDGALPLRSEQLHDDHRALLAALGSAPPDRRWLVYPRGDLRSSRQHLPSRWLLDSASANAGRTIYSTDFPDLGPPVVEVVASFAGGLRETAVPGSARERDLIALDAHRRSGGDVADHPAAASVARGIACERARRSDHLTEWDGNLAGLPVPSPARGEVLSATRLERWASCGFRYFLADVLHLRDRDDPERIIEISPIDRGSAVHEVLERFYRTVVDAGPPAPAERWSDDHRRLLRSIAADTLDEMEQRGRTGRPVRWRFVRSDLLATLDRFLTKDDVHRAATGSTPAHAELAFGSDERPPVVIDLPDGRSVRFRGFADRIDVGPGGHHLVSDYKTGKGKEYADLEADPVRAGTTLQLGLYAEAAIQTLGATTAEAHYWMVNEQADFARHGYRWEPSRRDRFVEVLTAIVDGIEQGAFAASPGDWNTWRRTHDNCTYCDFDRVCPTDRGEHAEVKLAAPEVRLRERLLPSEEGT